MGLDFRKKMSLNLMSLIGVGRVGLRPNSDDVPNYTLFFLKSSLNILVCKNGMV